LFELLLQIAFESDDNAVVIQVRMLHSCG